MLSATTSKTSVEPVSFQDTQSLTEITLQATVSRVEETPPRRVTQGVAAPKGAAVIGKMTPKLGTT